MLIGDNCFYIVSDGSSGGPVTAFDLMKFIFKFATCSFNRYQLHAVKNQVIMCDDDCLGVSPAYRV